MICTAYANIQAKCMVAWWTSIWRSITAVSCEFLSILHITSTGNLFCFFSFFFGTNVWRLLMSRDRCQANGRVFWSGKLKINSGLANCSARKLKTDIFHQTKKRLKTKRKRQQKAKRNSQKDSSKKKHHVYAAFFHEIDRRVSVCVCVWVCVTVCVCKQYS